MDTMFSFIEQIASCFIGITILRLFESAFTSARTGRVDVTTDVQRRLSPSVADVLVKSRVRVFRERWQGRLTYAYTRLIFPSTSIVIDYNEATIDAELEDFIVAHELGHVTRHHLIIKLLVESFYLATITAFAIRLTLHIHPLVNAALIAIPIILVGTLLVYPLSRTIAKVNEFSADLFAAKFVGLREARERLSTLRETVPALDCKELKDLDDRLKRLNRRARIAEGGNHLS